MKITFQPSHTWRNTRNTKGGALTNTIIAVASAAILTVGGCYAIKRPGAPKARQNAKDRIEEVFDWYAPTGVSENLLADKVGSLFAALKGNTTQRIFYASPTDQWNNNEPEDGVWFVNGDVYVTCKTDSETFGPDTITIAAHNVASTNNKPADFTWSIVLDDDTVTITRNGQTVRGNDTVKDQYLKETFDNLKTNF